MKEWGELKLRDKWALQRLLASQAKSKKDMGKLYDPKTSMLECSRLKLSSKQNVLH